MFIVNIIIVIEKKLVTTQMSIVGRLEEGILWRQYNIVVKSAYPGAAWVWIPTLPWIHFVTLGKSLTLLCLSFLVCKMGTIVIQALESYCQD